MNVKKNIIVDLDGTLAYDDHRRPLISSHGWSTYFAALQKDEPNLDLITLLQHLSGVMKIHIFTGRCDSVKKETEDWLSTHKVPYDVLCMRPKDTPYPNFHKPLSEQAFVTDSELKFKMLERYSLHPYNVVMVFDDRNEMVDWWRLRGFSCSQVRPEGPHINPLTGEKK